MEQSNPIACELCRTKKCKCDRRVPTCSQCEAAGTTCQYPPSNKRGIPSGYISSLEQRLLETETALFEALSFINTQLPQAQTLRNNSSSGTAFSEHSITQSKDAKMDEWKCLPLATDVQLQVWLQEKTSIVEKKSDVLIETEQKWIEQPVIQSTVRQRSISTSQQAPNQVPFLQSQMTHVNAEKGFQDLDLEKSGQRNVQHAQNPAQMQQMDPSGGILVEDTWWNQSAPPQMSDRNRKANGSYDTSVDILSDNSHYLPVTEEVGSVTRVEPLSPQDRRSSISSSSRNENRFSSKEWRKYF